MKICRSLVFVGAALIIASGFQAYAAERPKPPPAAENPRYYTALAQVNVRYKEFEDAIENFKKAIEFAPEGEIDRNLIISLARAHMGLGQVDEAKGVLDLGLVDLEEDQVPRYLMSAAQVYLEKGMHEEAVALLTRAREEAKNAHDDRNITSMLLSVVVGLPTADAYREGLRLRVQKNPKDIRALRDLMILHMYAKDIEPAREIAQKLHDLKPESVSVLMDLALFARADEHPEKAAEIYIQLMDKDPENKVRYGREVIGFYTEQNELDKALLWADKIAADDSRVDLIYDRLARSYQKADDKHKALECYTKAIAISPKRDMYKLSYAGILIDLGRTDEAGELLKPLLQARSARTRSTAQDLLLRVYKDDAGKDN